MSRRKPLFILALDGGGVRGALTASILKRLERETSFLKRVDVFAGTSTGSIIALMLANGASASDVAQEYKFMLPRVFGRPRPFFRRAFAAKYDPAPLERALTEYFGNVTLGRLSKYVVIPALRVDGRPSSTHHFLNDRAWRPAVFSNLPAVAGVLPDLDLRVVDAALRSSAAPTYFPVHQGYADGGVWANNPAMVAYGKSLLHLPSRPVKILSIGSGNWTRRVKNAGDLGLLQWSPYLFDLLLDASTFHTELSALLLRNNYCRISPELDPLLLDDVSAVSRLMTHDVDIDHALHFLRHLDDDTDDASFDDIGGSAGQLHSHQWADLVDLAWLDVVKPGRGPRGNSS